MIKKSSFLASVTVAIASITLLPLLTSCYSTKGKHHCMSKDKKGHHEKHADKHSCSSEKMKDGKASCASKKTKRHHSDD